MSSVPPSRPHPNGLLPHLQAILEILTIALFIATFILQPFRIPSDSMQPTLLVGDFLLANKQSFAPTGPLDALLPPTTIHRGDIVIFHYPLDPDRALIKRVIALPGDTVRIDHGDVYVNDRPIPEPYVPNRYRDERSEPEHHIPAGSFWVMGDHRNISSDSRDFGPVPRALIYGKAAFVYWPMDQTGVVH